jgi:lysophospholipase L1-like esterase
MNVGRWSILVNKKTLLMVGDSVTDADRDRSAAMGADSLGHGYVFCLDQMLKMHDKKNEVIVVNRGVSGNTIKDLTNRWEVDVLKLKPDWLSIMIGVNDVWRQFDSPGLPSISTLDEYEKYLSDLISLTRDTVEKIILMTPFLVEPNQSDPMRSMLNGYANVVRQVVVREKLILIDTQEKFDFAMTQINPKALAEDRIHPTKAGHKLIAEALMDSLFNNH